MAPAHAGGRMGGCETHSADLRTTRRAPRPLPQQPTTGRLFLAPDHRPPLARVKLVRPRPRPDGRYRCGRSSLTRPRGGAEYGQLRGKPAESRTREPDDSEATGPAHHALLTRGSPMGGLSARPQYGLPRARSCLMSGRGGAFPWATGRVPGWDPRTAASPVLCAHPPHRPPCAHPVSGETVELLVVAGGPSVLI
jgi:hypothetical protein